MSEQEQQHELAIEAGEYVLGTADEDSRRRFEQRLAQDPAAARELAYWERRLGSLGLALAPVEPPATVWRNIAGQLSRSDGQGDGHRGAARGGSNVAAAAAPAANDSRFWRSAAIAASVVALVLGGLLFTQSPGRYDVYDMGGPNPPHTYTSIVYDDPTDTGWLMTARAGSDEMKVVALGDYQVPEGKVLRAWLKPAEGQALPLGEWPQDRGGYTMSLSDTALQHLDGPSRLMVSMEDAGGAAGAAPNGELMWSAPILSQRG